MKVLETTGSGVIRQVNYIGGLTVQFWSSLRAAPRVLPVVGKRGRWQTAMRQIVAIGVQGLPLIAVLSTCVGFILALKTAAELRRFGASEETPEELRKAAWRGLRRSRRARQRAAV